MRFSDYEISELAKAWIAISLAFAFVWSDIGRVYGLSFVMVYLMAALTVGGAFIIHELAHKYFAQKFGCWAEFRSFNLGLLLAIFMSFFGGIVFAAPGAVMISGLVTKEENGKIAAAGPISNIILAAGFWLLSNLLAGKTGYILLDLFLGFGYSVNSWLAFFNLIPLGPLDGVKVLRWSQTMWILLVIVSGAMTFLLGG